MAPTAQSYDGWTQHMSPPKALSQKFATTNRTIDADPLGNRITKPGLEIIDIRRNKIEPSLLNDLLNQLRPRKGKEKTMPTLLLYDEAGLKLFEDITYLEEYYLTNAEIEVLESHANQIAQHLLPGSMLIELGSGNLRKVDILLKALDRLGRNVEYYALDLSLAELQRTLAAVPEGKYEYVKCYGLHGTYDDGLHWLKRAENSMKPKCVLSLGSSIGNFPREEAADFLRSFGQVLQRQDSMLVGLDACKDKDKVFNAYNDQEGVTHQFLRNGLSQANELIGNDVFKQEDWQIIGEYDEAAGRHHAFYSPIRDLSLEGIHFEKGERVKVEESYKYSKKESDLLWQRAGLLQAALWSNETNQYFIHMLFKPQFSFALQPAEYAARPIPELSEWEDLWAAWDTVTLGMISKEDLLSKPIKLRNACIFYLGHIPTFLDMHLTRSTGGKSTDPGHYPQIFERGIDPDVDNPEHCHAHSEIPDSWPPVEEILHFQDQVRSRVRHVYETSVAEKDRKIGRALWLTFEHEIMHLETLLYMLLQSDKALPPPGTMKPDFVGLARSANSEAVPNKWITIPENQIVLGLEDPENDSGTDRYFGWDNEKPARTIKVPTFTAKARPISNSDYAQYLDNTQKTSIPASWFDGSSAKRETHSKGFTRGYVNGDSTPLSQAYLEGKSVRTVYGLVALEYALNWPVMASYDELVGCAKWMDGRIPTMEEVRSIYTYVDAMKTEEAEKVLGRTISAVNGQMSNEGVEETPPSPPALNVSSSADSSPDPHQLFANLKGCNVGFKHWHPTPVTQNGDNLSGQGEMGGAWEWTSSVLERHEGFEPMDLYPAYTADFFDGKHNVVLGGSWATHPRIAGRKTFVNWYQRNYPYAWAGARVVRDA
ncbi:MAG: hypothetical protein M1827_002404 [Pycnora praestabilis]|nr:MAG: hypothetical protein M1827_002404 [Pycnora praestabilis]